MTGQRVRQLVLFALVGCGCVGGSGCATMNNTERGALGGGVVGTAAGTAIGAATGRPLLGAGLGAAVGTATGALVGNEADKDENKRREIAQAAALADAQAQQQRMGIADVIALAQGQHSDQVIINQIRSTRSTFQLTASDLDMLKNAGVSQRVIAEMQASRPALAPARVVVREQPTVIYDSPPPVYVRPAPVYVYGPRPYCHSYGAVIIRR
jgi:hypothetical protein